MSCVPPPPGIILHRRETGPQSSRLSLPSHRLCLSFFCSLAMQELLCAAQGPVPVLRWGDSQVMPWSVETDLESDPGTRLSCLFPTMSGGLRGRGEALLRDALASPFLCPRMFECSQSQEKILSNFFPEAKAEVPVLLFCAS